MASSGRARSRRHKQKFALVSTPETDEAEAIWEAYHLQAQELVGGNVREGVPRAPDGAPRQACRRGCRDDEPGQGRWRPRAGAWRLMEAGRAYERAYLAAPTANATWNALDSVFATNRLRSLNAFQVSTTQKLFDLANCEMYVGVRLDGKTCLGEGDNPYEVAAEAKKKRRRKGKGKAEAEKEGKR